MRGFSSVGHQRPRGGILLSRKNVSAHVSEINRWSISRSAYLLTRIVNYQLPMELNLLADIDGNIASDVGGCGWSG